MSNVEELNIQPWVEQAQASSDLEFRQAIHTILSAISTDHYLKASMILKGGILLAIRYHSHRYTTDIDLSTAKTIGDELNRDTIIKALNESLSAAVESLDYGLDCRVQSVKQNPKNPDATFPAFRIKVGYAYKGSPKHKKLQGENSPSVISMDYSLNEPTPNVDHVMLGQGDSLQVYSLTDLIAEKYRALLQQVSRNRHRRQDIFDLFLLLEVFSSLDDVEKQKIHDSLMSKAMARGITPMIESIDDSELRKRAQRDYPTLANEVAGDLPDFDTSFNAVSMFYKSLPWTD